MCAKEDAKGHRWVVSLANYNFGMHYKSVKTNVDVLSRFPWNVTLENDIVQAITKVILEGSEALIGAYICNISLAGEVQ